MRDEPISCSQVTAISKKKRRAKVKVERLCLTKKESGYLKKLMKSINKGAGYR